MTMKCFAHVFSIYTKFLLQKLRINFYESCDEEDAADSVARGSQPHGLYDLDEHLVADMTE
jgi:hypothetical protein